MTTMRAIVDDTVDINAAREHFLYLVRNEAIVWYVGQSINPVERLQAHLGLTWRARSNVASLFQRHLPRALEWTVMLSTLVDCEPLVKHYILPQFAPYYTLRLYYDPARLPGSIAFAEQALIEHYHPYLNVRMKSFFAPVPQENITSVGSSSEYLIQIRRRGNHGPGVL